MATKQKLLITILIPFLVIGITTRANAEEWKTKDKVLLTTYLTGEVIDVLQTHEILRNDRYYELNPLIKNDTDLTISAIITTTIIIVIANKLPKYRTLFLKTVNAIKWSLVINNHAIGVRIKF